MDRREEWSAIGAEWSELETKVSPPFKLEKGDSWRAAKTSSRTSAR